MSNILHWPFGTQPPNLIPANISSVVTLLILYVDLCAIVKHVHVIMHY